MNVYDSNRIADVMTIHGYKTTSNMLEADVILLNTCHIREKAAEKVYSELGRIKKQTSSNPPTIVVAGCVGQAEGDEIFDRCPYVDIVIGPQSYHNLPILLQKLEEGERKLIELDFNEEEKFDKLPEEIASNGVSNFVSIQEGCDKFCTYCVVPYTRGAEYSRNVEQIYREVLQLVSKGSKEIILLGQNVNGYHGFDENKNEWNLAKLIKKISKIKGLERIRYTTSHPQDMDQELIQTHGEIEKLMPFLHLPVQSGSDKILKAMNRKYTSQQYIEILHQLQENRPDIVFSSDFIVGFPGESDEDFEQTINLVKKIKYGQCYSFKYSTRPGTPAALKAQIPENIKSERLTILQKELMKQQKELNESHIGSSMKILFEKNGKFENQIMGKSPYMQSVYLQIQDLSRLQGELRDVRIISASQNSLQGELE